MESNFSDNNINKILPEKKITYDVVEKKEAKLKNLKNNTDKIKKESIKEFIYTNKNIPIIWKTKKNYQNLVLDIFNEDNNFLKYLGNNIQKKKKLNTIINRPKTSINEKNIRNLELERKKQRKLSYNTFIKPKKKIRMLLSPQVEIENIFEELKEKYPINNKVKDLFPYYNFEEEKKDKIGNSSFDRFNKKKFSGNTITTSKSKYLKKMEKNIYNNLFSRENTTISFNNQNITKTNNDFEYKRKNRIKIMKKELNDPRIFHLLQNLNLYGPYFSYCPCCFDKNIIFYKNFGRKQCISLLNYIKDDKIKEREIKESKYRERNNTNIF